MRYRGDIAGVRLEVCSLDAMKSVKSCWKHRCAVLQYGNDYLEQFPPILPL